MRFKVTITALNSKGREQIVDCCILDTREEVKSFIQECRAIPKEYRPARGNTNCFYEITLAN
jgi:hypothetical protein